MFSQTDNSHQRYNEIWQPHRSLANFFTSNNEPSTANILKLLRMLRQHEYDLSFSLSRDPDMLAAMDWAAYLQDIDRSRHFSQLFVRNAPIVVPGPNKGEIFSALCRAFIGQSDTSGSSLFFDIGCGVGNWLFEFMALEGRTKIRIVGIDISETAVETAQAISSWIGGKPAEFCVENLTFPAETPIDCEGRDVVFFSISVLNKIKILDSNVFQILVSRVKNYGRIRFVLIESFGWQIYRDKALNRFFWKWIIR